MSTDEDLLTRLLEENPDLDIDSLDPETIENLLEELRQEEDPSEFSQMLQADPDVIQKMLQDPSLQKQMMDNPPDFSRMMQQMQDNPGMMQSMLESPMMAQMMANPQLMSGLMGGIGLGGGEGIGGLASLVGGIMGGSQSTTSSDAATQEDTEYPLTNRDPVEIQKGIAKIKKTFRKVEYPGT